LQAFRAKAKQEGVSFKAAMEARKADLKTQKVSYSPVIYDVWL
jgi:hypothetical protein